jgi:hypothetical protein
MTAKTWCAISKAVEIIRTAQNTSVGRAQAWLIGACVAGNIRSRVPSSADSQLLLNDNGFLSIDLRPGSQPGIISRSPKPVSAAAWKDAVIDGDVLVDTNLSRWPDLEISIAHAAGHLRCCIGLRTRGGFRCLTTIRLRHCNSTDRARSVMASWSCRRSTPSPGRCEPWVSVCSFAVRAAG